jgi:hypothetical protein
LFNHPQFAASNGTITSQSFGQVTSQANRSRDIQFGLKISSNFAECGEIPSEVSSRAMTAADFQRIALSLEGAEEISHAGLPAFQVAGRRFASLASQTEGYGNLTLTLEQQAAFVEDAPEIFLPIPGGWGRMGHTHIRLAAPNEDVLTGALTTAWKLRIEKNEKVRRKRRP